MKLLYLTILLVIATASNAFATVITATNNNGRWNLGSTWDLNRKPQAGDTAIITNNILVLLNSNESVNNLVVRITGTLRLSNGKLNLDNASRIDIMTGGTLTGSGNSDQVRIGGDFKFRGGFDLPVLGPAYADNTTGTSPNGFNSGLSLLSEHIADFYVSRINGNAYIGWNSVPGNTIQFEVEKSMNGIGWSVIGTVPVGGDRNLRQLYSYIDKNLVATTAYYRIKQVLPAGIVYTAVKAVTDHENAGIDIYAGSRRTINARFNQPATFPVKISVMDMGGRIIQQQSFDQIGSINLQLKAATRGTVIVNVSDAAGESKSRIIVL